MSIEGEDGSSFVGSTSEAYVRWAGPGKTGGGARDCNLNLGLRQVLFIFCNLRDRLRGSCTTRVVSLEFHTLYYAIDHFPVESRRSPPILETPIF